MSKKSELVRLKNEDPVGAMLNLVAEYSFGNLDDDNFKHILNANPDFKEQMEKAVEYYKKAIDLGLTYEMSTEGGDDAAEIWGKVEEGLDD